MTSAQLASCRGSFRVRTRRRCVVPTLLSALLAQPVAAASTASLPHTSGIGTPFGVDDYFRVRRISEIALSTDGTQVAYVADRRSLEENAIARAAYLQAVQKDAEPIALDELRDARDLTWIPNSRELAFISTRAGVPQVFALDVQSRVVRTLTSSTDPVTKFRITQKGTLAYLTLKQSDPIYDRLRREGPGIVVDTDSVGFMDLVDAGRAAELGSGSLKLWVSKRGGRAEEVNVPGEAREFWWSPDEQFLSITYIPSYAPPSMFRSNCTAVGLYSVADGRLRELAETTHSSGATRRTWYSGGEWVPHSRQLAIRRISEPNLWRGDPVFPELAIVEAGAQLADSRQRWTPLELYPRMTSVFPINSSTVYIGTRSRAVDTLLALSGGEVRKSDVIAGLTGSSSSFRFSADFRTTVFVNESLTRPPELYVQRKGKSSWKLTRLNQDLSHLKLPIVREVTWASRDGTTVSGWLLMSPSSQDSRVQPLLTYVHGGPGYAYPDTFASFSGSWPYPFEVIALRGINVFIPQYRGTLSFGRKFARPNRIDREPIEDIVTGIDHLVRSGLADATRLAIAGHSHGAWLGPMTATKTNMFRAGSFAEGWSNHVTVYELNSGRLNREVHEAGIGEPSLYEAPERYLELSPDLHFRDLTMATLFEAGAEAIAIQMLGMKKAARHFGIPSELVVYPQTGHAMTIPRLQRECAERNLDWFLFWLLHEEDDDSKKIEQYRRWRSLTSAPHTSAVSRFP
jgi:dipeptidyl aminopeptidase/acylaminoacyl peptidase